MAVPDPNDRVYETKILSKIFAIGSIILLVTTVWIVIEDYERPWKSFARQAQKIDETVAQAKLSEANKNIDKKLLDNLKQEKVFIEKELVQLNKEINSKVEKLNGEYYKLNIVFQSKKSELESALFYMNSAFHHNDPEKYKKLKKQYDKDALYVEELRNKTLKAEIALNNAKEVKKDINFKNKQLETRLASVNGEITKQEKIIKENEQSLFNVVRNAPIVDAVVPTVKIKQIILPNLKVDYHFNQVQRVDRCINCHAKIDQPGYENFPQPFATHSNLASYVGPNSKHPVNKFGCTVCHAGEGRSLDFSFTGHMPRNKSQEKEWVAKWDFERKHHVENPMLPVGMTEASCIQCHAKNVELAGAPVLNRGMRLIERSGCYECHKVKGYFEEKSKMVEHAPSLESITSKVSEQWLIKWLWWPKDFRPTTMMPAFWQLHNNSDPQSMERAAVEIEGIVYYLKAKSKKYSPITYPETLASSISNGKKLTGEIGCLACHAVDDFPRKNPEIDPDMGYPKEMAQKDNLIPMFGPELNQMGSKVTKQWLYSWLKNPNHYWKNTNMPDMRLSDQQAVDVSAYLLSKKNTDFANKSVPAIAKDSIRDQIMLADFNKQLPVLKAKEKLASLSLEDKKMWVGEKMISHYGCYTCHAISGFEGKAQIGAELTYEGSKSLSKFSFDNVHVPHTRHDWIKAKIKNPRSFDVGLKRSFDAKTRMPHFGFNDAQAEAIATVISGLKKSTVDEIAKYKVSARIHDLIEGEKVIRRKNCLGCHTINNLGGEILAHYPDDFSEGPPNLNNQGYKTKPDWLYSFFNNVKPIRPWLSVRMPSYKFEKGEVTALTKYFTALDSAPYPFSYEADFQPLSPEDYTQARGMFNDLACLSCHAVLSEGEDTSIAAPHLFNVKKRLKGSYVVDWLRDPNKIMPGTRMPELWPLDDPDDPNSKRMAVPGYFDDDAEKQLKAMRNYLYMYKGEEKNNSESTSN